MGRAVPARPMLHQTQGGLLMNIVIQAVISSLAIGGIYALLALGYTIIFSTMKMSHFAQDDFFMIGTFFA